MTTTEGTRIAFYAPMKAPTHPIPSGDRKMGRLLLQTLRLAGYRPTLASDFRTHPGLGKDKNKTLSPHITQAGAIEAERLITLFTSYRKEERPKLWFTYHLYHKSPDHLGPRVAKALDIPYVVAEASHAEKQETGPWREGFLAARSALLQADAILAMTRRDQQYLQKLVEPSRLSLLPPFLDPSPFLNAQAARMQHRHALIQRLSLPTDSPWLLSVAMMRPGDKLASYLMLAEALKNCRDHPWHLLIAGDGPGRSDIEAAFTPLCDRITFLGALPEESLPPLYAAADLLVWPGINEAYGMTVLEAAAAGVAMIIGYTEGVADFITNGVHGLLPKARSCADFSRSVCQLLTNPKARDTLARAAQHRLLTERTPETTASLLYSKINPLLR